MRKLKFWTLLGLAILLLLVVAQNTGPVHARFLWLSAEVPAVLLLLLTAAVGFTAGYLAARLARRAPRWKP